MKLENTIVKQLKKLENKSFVVFAPNDWDGQWMNRQQLFSRIGLAHDVIYSTGAFHSWEVGSTSYKKAKLKACSIIDHAVRVFSPSKLHVRQKKIIAVDQYVLRRFSHSLLHHLGLNKTDVLYLFHPSYLDYIDAVPHSCLVYHAYDDLSKQGGYDGYIENKEKQLLAKADLVFASSRLIQNRLIDISGREDVVFIPNGVDFDCFSDNSVSEPTDICSIPHPRIGYVGAINRKVDLGLLMYMAENLSGCSFVMVGPIGQIDSADERLLDKLKDCKNVYFLGSKAPDEISAYMHHCDINTMIYKSDQNLWASSGYPLKLHEYLAVGKPVISADIESVREFGDVVIIPDSKSAWLGAIRSCLDESNTSKKTDAKRKVAMQNTWDNRVEALLEGLSAVF